MDERAPLSEKKETTFDPQILIEKLAKLNLSQASIETLSYWCIFHMNNAKYVVDTWEREFHSSPQEQRVAFLYLANDIMQNSRKKGIEFVNEFGRVLPDALCNVVHNGDDFGRNAAYRLLNIWEERKVFDSHVELLTEEFKRRLMNGANQNRKDAVVRPKKPVGNILDKIVSCYQVVRGGQREEVIVNKCRATVSFLEKTEKDAVQNNLGEGELLENMQGQHAMLRNCIEQLAAVESSRARLVTCLRDALQEQEFKLRHVHDLLQVARTRSEKTANIFRNFSNDGSKQFPDRHDSLKDAHSSDAPVTFAASNVEQPSPAMYPLQPPYREMSGQLQEEKKPDIAIMSTKLTALTSSSQLSSVLTSLASEGVIGNPGKDSSGEYTPEKRPRLDNSQFTFQDVESSNGALQPPLPPTSAPPPIPPPPPPGPPSMGSGSPAPFPGLPSTAPHFIQVPPGMPAVTFTYGVGPHQHQPPPGTIPPFPGSDGPYHGPPASVPMASMPQQ